MKLNLTKFGAEPKKLVILGGLLVVAGYFFFTRDSGDVPASTKPAGSATPATNQRASLRTGNRLRPGERGMNTGPKEWQPSFKVKDIDPSGVDPTLHLALLAKLQDVKVETSGRSLFEIGTPPPTPAEVAKLKEPEKIKPTPFGPQLPPPPPCIPPPVQEAPPCVLPPAQATPPCQLLPPLCTTTLPCQPPLPCQLLPPVEVVPPCQVLPPCQVVPPCQLLPLCQAALLCQ